MHVCYVNFLCHFFFICCQHKLLDLDDSFYLNIFSGPLILFYSFLQCQVLFGNISYCLYCNFHSILSVSSTTSSSGLYNSKALLCIIIFFPQIHYLSILALSVLFFPSWLYCRSNSMFSIWFPSFLQTFCTSPYVAGYMFDSNR